MYEEEFDYSQEWLDSIIKYTDRKLFGKKIDSDTKELKSAADQMMQTAYLKRGHRR